MSSRALTPAEVPRFDVVQAVTPVGTAPCAECRTAIVDTYFEWDGKVICATCQPRIAATIVSGRSGSMARALTLGLVAAVAGAGIYYGITALTGRDIAVALLLVGFAIGKAVRIGAGGRGGRRYQWLAAGLTYATIASTYVPLVTSGFGSHGPAPASASVIVVEAPATSEAVSSAPSLSATALPSSRPTIAHLAALLLLAGAAPLLAGFSNVVGIAVTMLAVIIPWRLNRAPPATIAGPFSVR